MNVMFLGEGMAPSLRDSGLCGGASNPTLKRGANQHCAYGAIASISGLKCETWSVWRDRVKRM